MGDFQIWRRSVAHGGAPLGLLYAVAAVGKSPPSVPIVDVAVREEELQIWRRSVAHGGAPLGLLYAVAAVGKSPPSVPIVDVAVREEEEKEKKKKKEHLNGAFFTTKNE